MENGRDIVAKVNSIWSPNQIFYHFGKRGGHVAAMRVHSESAFFAKIDLSQFFVSITRTKVVRSLKKIGISNKEAFEIAYQSVVDFGGQKFIPYGFVQSMALATICMETSALGKVLMDINGRNTLVSVYVDDIIISSDCMSALEEAYIEACEAIKFARLVKNDTKSQPPARSIEAFNCRISTREMKFTPERMRQFLDDYASGNPYRQEAILRYMQVVNEAQAVELVKSFI